MYSGGAGAGSDVERQKTASRSRYSTDSAQGIGNIRKATSIQIRQRQAEKCDGHVTHVVIMNKVPEVIKRCLGLNLEMKKGSMMKRQAPVTEMTIIRVSTLFWEGML
jgi:hypothetical protein